MFTPKPFFWINVTINPFHGLFECSLTSRLDADIDSPATLEQIVKQMLYFLPSKLAENVDVLIQNWSEPRFRELTKFVTSVVALDN